MTQPLPDTQADLFDRCCGRARAVQRELFAPEPSPAAADDVHPDCAGQGLLFGAGEQAPAPGGRMP